MTTLDVQAGAPLVALVTGASGSIGAAVARMLSRAGLSVALAAREPRRCEELAAELGSGGARALTVALDVTDPASIRAGCAAAAELGPVDVLVNNAGIAESARLLAGGEADELFARHFAVNFDGPRRLAEQLLPGMLERRRGAVVNVASSAALRGYAYVSAYCASKHALLGWTRAAALELRSSGVGVHAVCPHYVDSAMTDAAVANIVARTGREPADVRAWLAAENPGGRLVTPAEVAGAVLALALGGGTGRVLELDGLGSRELERVLESAP